MNIKLDYIFQDSKNFMNPAQFPSETAMDYVDIELETRTFPVYKQNAGIYGEYSRYMNSHGCACCSLTTILAAYTDHMKGLLPQETASKIERMVFDDEEWHGNYDKPMRNQMPVSFAGICRVLTHFDVPHLRCAAASEDIIIEHLLKGKSVLIETSKVRHFHGIPVSINDKRFAGSYHTMVILGVEEDLDTVWVTDSATRSWADHMQRLKRVSLKELLKFTFTCRDMDDQSPYFNGRKSSGGCILVG